MICRSFQGKPFSEVPKEKHQICSRKANGNDARQRLFTCYEENRACFTQRFPKAIFWKLSLATKANLSSNKGLGDLLAKMEHHKKKSSFQASKKEFVITMPGKEAWIQFS
jgi:hypothetical protein